jgi:hypothetical protein
MGIVEALIEIAVKIISELLAKVAGIAAERAMSKTPQEMATGTRQTTQAYFANCGDDGLDLKRQRLFFFCHVRQLFCEFA